MVVPLINSHCDYDVIFPMQPNMCIMSQATM